MVVKTDGDRTISDPVEQHQTVWLASFGSYSDYYVAAVFTDKTLADEFQEANRENYELNDLQEMIVNVPSEKHGYFYSCGFDSNGDVIRVDKTCRAYVELNRVCEGGGRKYVYVIAKDPKHATQIAADCWRAHIANVPPVS